MKKGYGDMVLPILFLVKNNELRVSSHSCFSRFKVSLFPYIYRDLKRSVFSKRGKILWNSWEKERETARKKFSKWLYGWDIIVWYTCLQLVVITPQHYTVISQYQMWTHVSLFLQGHFLFVFLNIGYHCEPNPLLLESVFNQMKGLYWRIFLVGKKKMNPLKN